MVWASHRAQWGRLEIFVQWILWWIKILLSWTRSNWSQVLALGWLLKNYMPPYFLKFRNRRNRQLEKNKIKIQVQTFYQNSWEIVADQMYFSFQSTTHDLWYVIKYSLCAKYELVSPKRSKSFHFTYSFLSLSLGQYY